MKLATAMLMSQVSFLVAQTKPAVQPAEFFTDAGLTEIMGHSFGTNPVSVWSGGALLTVQDAQSGAPIFEAFDKSGRRITRFEFQIEGVRLINITSGGFARALDGSFAIVGSASANDGRGAAFLAIVSPDGQQQTVVRLNPWIPRAVTVAADGTIWTAGYEKDADGSLKSEYNVIRRFDRTGAPLDFLVSRSTLNPSLNNQIHIGYTCLVAARDGRVGWYSEGAGTFIEFSADAKIVRQIPVGSLHADDELRPRRVVFGVGLCDGGSLFVSANWIPTTGPREWGIYVFDQKRGDWNLVSRPGKWGMVYGCDGTTLATRTTETNIHWLDFANR